MENLLRRGRGGGGGGSIETAFEDAQINNAEAGRDIREKGDAIADIKR